MQNTILIISLTLITALAVGYFLRARKTTNELKNTETKKTKTNKEAAAKI